MSEELTESQRELVEYLPATLDELTEEFDLAESSVRARIARVRNRLDDDDAVQYDRDEGVYRLKDGLDIDNPESKKETDRQMTESERELVSTLPERLPDLADELDTDQNQVLQLISSIKEKFEDDDVVAEEGGVYFWNGSEKKKRVAIKSKQKVTYELNEMAIEEEDYVVRRLKQKGPLTAVQQPKAGNQDLILHFTDLHMGDVTEDDRSIEQYNPEMAANVPLIIAKKVIMVDKALDTDFDTVHIALGGDMVTGEDVYQGQPFHIRRKGKEQLVQTIDPLLRMIETLADHFPTVQVVGVQGNHGDLGTNTSRQLNLDLIMYHWLKDRLIDRGWTNIDFEVSEATPYKNFDVRGGRWRAHLRHGEEALGHIGTPSAKERWANWADKHKMDIGLRGHFHEARREPVHNRIPVYESPSAKVDDDFAERIGMPDNSDKYGLASLIAVSDENRVEWDTVLKHSDLIETEDVSCPFGVAGSDVEVVGDEADAASFSPSAESGERVATDGGQAFADDGWMIPDEGSDDL